MPILNPTDLTFNGKEVQSLSGAIFNKTFNKPSLKEFHQIVEGIKAKQQIVFLGLMGLTGKKKTGCSTPIGTNTIQNSEKYWNPVIIAEKFGECWDTIKETFFVWGTKNGISRDDLTDTDFANFLEDRMSDALLEALFRVSWFGDKTAEEAPDGLLTAGTDVDYFNPVDGFWKQLFAIAPSSSSPRRVEITRNAQTSYTAQAFTNTDTTNMVATNIFASLKYNADYRLREQNNLVYIATQSLTDQYVKELRSQQLDASFTRIESGYQAIMFEGIPVIPVNFFDRYIRDYFDDGDKLYMPHRAVLTTTDNLAIGVESSNNLSELDSWFSRDDRKYYVEFSVNIDAKVLEDELVQVAY